MMRNRVLTAALAAALTLGAAGTGAAADSDSNHRQQQRSPRAERADAAETAEAFGARGAPADAVAAAERAVDGRAAKLSMENENGMALYEVRVAAADRVVSVKIDPATGAVRGTERAGLIARVFDREDWAGIRALQEAPTTLGQAIAAAERAADGGRAVEAAWEGEDHATGYEVEVVREGGAVTKTVVDARSGQARPASPERSGHR